MIEPEPWATALEREEENRKALRGTHLFWNRVKSYVDQWLYDNEPDDPEEEDDE